MSKIFGALTPAPAPVVSYYGPGPSTPSPIVIPQYDSAGDRLTINTVGHLTKAKNRVKNRNARNNKK